MCLYLGWTTSNYCESNLCVVKENVFVSHLLGKSFETGRYTIDEIFKSYCATFGLGV